MLKIKFAPTGKKHAHQYRIVVAEEHSKLTGMAKDNLGTYNPHTQKTEINSASLENWLKQGAQPTPEVRKILKIK